MVPKHRPIAPVLMIVLLRNFHCYFASANEGLIYLFYDVIFSWGTVQWQSICYSSMIIFVNDEKTQRNWQPFSNYVFCSLQICITHMHERFNYLEICIKAYLKSIYKDCIPTFFCFLLNNDSWISINFRK